MSFISKKLKNFKRIGNKVAHRAANIARKAGKTVGRLSEFAGAIAPFVELIPGGQAIGASLAAGSVVGSQIGNLGEDIGRSGSKYLDDGNVEGLLERTKNQISTKDKIQSNFRN